jgi:uncharacterized membrane protein
VLGTTCEARHRNLVTGNLVTGNLVTAKLITMAGIGFELRKLLERDSITGLAQAYAYAAIISSGPWVLSIVGILVVGFMSASVVSPAFGVTQFQVSVTYLIAASLVLTGPAQLSFTRFIADRLFEKKLDMVLPNFNGILLVVILFAGGLGMPAVLFLFSGRKPGLPPCSC